MDTRLLVIVAGLFLVVAGFICVAPGAFEVLGLPQVFIQLGGERTLTGVALIALGVIAVINESGGESKPAHRATLLNLDDAPPRTAGPAPLPVPERDSLRPLPRPARQPPAKLAPLEPAPAPVVDRAPATQPTPPPEP